MSLNPRRVLRVFVVLFAVAFAWPGAARAACNGLAMTANTTKFWTYVTILDPTKTVTLDAGFIPPHTTKSWTGAAARGICGFPLSFQYQVTSVTGPTAPAKVGVPIADVSASALMGLPANVLIADLGHVPMGPAGATFWLDQTDTLKVASAIKTSALNALSCLKTADETYFGADDSTYCSKPPVSRPPVTMPDSAGCGTIITLNQTDHWVWITIYPLDHEEHYDWGWVAPHNFREWHAGGAPVPMSYMCGSFYYVRYEIKQPHNQVNPTDGPNIFDTTMRINPQLSADDILKLVVSIGHTLVCVTSPEVIGECVAEWGMEQGADAALFGMVGSEAEGSVVCVKSSDDTHFWLENTSNCATPPPNGKLPPKGPDVYAFTPTFRRVGIGSGGGPGNSWLISRNGATITDVNVYNKCSFTTDHPDIAKFDHPKVGSIHGIRKGTTAAHWSCDGKTIASGTVQVD